MPTTEAGRELDALVAEKVIGGAAAGGFMCPSCGGSQFGTSNPLGPPPYNRACHDEFGQRCTWHGPAIDAVPSYSTDISAAWQIVEHMREMGFTFELHDHHSDRLWNAFFYKAWRPGQRLDRRVRHDLRR